MKNDLIKELLNLLAKRTYGLSIEEIAQSLNINRGTASKYLAILLATNKIKVREIGKVKLHYLRANWNG